VSGAGQPPGVVRGTLRLLSRGELWLLLLVSAWSVTLLVALLVRAHDSGLVFIGADSRAPGDQLQYLAWIRDAGRHGLAANLYGFGQPARVFLHPMWLLSGLAVAAGAGPAVSLLIWKPVAVVLLFVAVRAYVRRLVPGRWPPRLAMLLALFYYPPVQTFVSQTGIGVTRQHVETALRNDLLPAFQLWGYLPAAIAIALTALTLLATEKALDPRRRSPGKGSAWYAAWAAAAGLTAAWLHPWEGETLAVVLVGLLVWDVRRRARLVPLLAVLGATVAPLIYYYVLSRANASWALAARQADFIRSSDLPVVGLGLAPLAVPALLGARGRALDVQERMLRLWPLATAVIYFVVRPPYPLHAFAGVAIPLSVLAVRWFTSIGDRLGRARAWLAAAAILALVGSCLPFAFQTVHRALSGDYDLTLLKPGDANALRYIAAAPGPGGVLTSGALGYAVPGMTGRETWVGHPVWTPDAATRNALAGALFSGALTPSAGEALVRRIGARFVLEPCGSVASLATPLAALGYRPRSFGCATVYQAQ